MARDTVLVPVESSDNSSYVGRLARQWADQYVEAIPGIRGSSEVGAKTTWQGLSGTLARLIPDLDPQATICFLGGSEQPCVPVPGVSTLSRTITLCGPNVALDPEIVFYNVAATSGPQQGKSLKSLDNDASQQGNPGAVTFRQNKRKAYDAIGAALQAKKVFGVTLLATGGVADLSVAKQLCADWGVLVGGYTRPLMLTIVDGRARLCFQGDPVAASLPARRGPGPLAYDSSNNPLGETDVPRFDGTTAFLFRPNPNGTVTQVI